MTSHCVLVAFVVAAGSMFSAQAGTWKVPPDADTLKSPLIGDPSVMKHGQSIFAGRCQKCHGPKGDGRGPQSSSDHPAANLVLAVTNVANSDGVLFYKIWNGNQYMPAFKSELGREDVWAVMEYIKTLAGPR